MISPPVPTEPEITGRLRELGFSETAQETDTGRFWKHEASEHHLLVPASIKGVYPDWIFNDLLLQAEKIAKKRVKRWPGWLPRPEDPVMVLDGDTTPSAGTAPTAVATTSQEP